MPSSAWNKRVVVAQRDLTLRRVQTRIGSRQLFPSSDEEQMVTRHGSRRDSQSGQSIASHKLATTRTDRCSRDRRTYRTQREPRRIQSNKAEQRVDQLDDSDLGGGVDSVFFKVEHPPPILLLYPPGPLPH